MIIKFLEEQLRTRRWNNCARSLWAHPLRKESIWLREKDTL